MPQTTPIKLENKKILYLVTQTKWGGAQKYVLELAKYFSQNNQVDIAFGEDEGLNEQFIEAAKKINVRTIVLKNLVRDINISKEISAAKELTKLLNKENYHLIHLNSSKAGLIGSLAAKFYAANPFNTRMRIVYTAHGFVFNEQLNPWMKKIYVLSETFSTGLQNLIIAVSEHDKQTALANKICPAYKIFVVPNGIEPKDYQFLDETSARERLALAPNKKYFGTIGSFYANKGHTYLVEAIKILQDKNSPLLKNHAWVFIGDGPDFDKIKKQVADAHLENFITIIKAKDQDWQYLPAFDYFILPSIKEGMPYTILEAGLARVPTIASRVGGIPEIIETEKTGLLTLPANPLSLVEAMEKITSDSALAKQLAHHNYQNVISRFSLKKTLETTEGLYLKLF